MISKNVAKMVVLFSIVYSLLMLGINLILKSSGYEPILEVYPIDIDRLQSAINGVEKMTPIQALQYIIIPIFVNFVAIFMAGWGLTMWKIFQLVPSLSFLAPVASLLITIIQAWCVIYYLKSVLTGG